MLFIKHFDNIYFFTIRITIIIIIMLAFMFACVFHLNKFKFFHIY